MGFDRADNEQHRGGEVFATTHWSVVLRVGQRDNLQAEEALAELCRCYWFPLYAFVRRRVSDVHEAQDLVQEFFVFLMEKKILAHVAPERGRFRSFLLASVKNFLNNEWDRTKSLKRGGGISKLSLDLVMGEVRLNREPSHNLTPERLFEKQWALTLLDLVISRLQSEFLQSGKSLQFEILKDTLTGVGQNHSYAEIAETLKMSEEAARQAAHRLRKRYRELLREEVANSLADPAEVDDEIKNLFEALGS